jgi:hypothetical protein
LILHIIIIRMKFTRAKDMTSNLAGHSILIWFKP